MSRVEAILSLSPGQDKSTVLINIKMPVEEEFEDYPALSSSRRKLCRARKTPTLRSLLASTAWLKVAPQWIEGQVVWPRAGTAHARSQFWRPARDDLKRSERALNLLAVRTQHYPEVTEREFRAWQSTHSDPDGSGKYESELSHWVEKMCLNLEAAKRLLPLAAPDLSALAKPSRARSPKSAQRLTELLTAEALCSNSLPISPAQTLVALNDIAQDPLWKLVSDYNAPKAARALAALVLGVLYSASSVHRVAPIPAVISSDPWINRAFGWCQRQGLPATSLCGPPLLVHLLETCEGERSAPAFLRVLNSTDDAGGILTASLLREWLARGVPLPQMPELIASITPMSAVFCQLQQRPDLRPQKAGARRRVARQARHQRQQLSTQIKQQLRAYWLTNPDPEIPALFASHVLTLLSLCEWHTCLAQAIVQPLQLGGTLPPSLQKPWLKLLTECRQNLWEINRESPSTLPVSWLNRCWEEQIRPLHAVLQRSQDPALTRKLLEIKLCPVVTEYQWRDVKLWTWLSELAQEYYLNEDSYQYWQICAVLSQFASLAQARATLGPVVAELAVHPPLFRKWTLLALLQALPASDLHILPDLAPYVPRLAFYAEQTRERFNGEPDISSVAEALVQMLKQSARARVRTNEADADISRRFEWLITHLLTHEERDEALPQEYNLSALVDVAWVLGNVHFGDDWPLEKQPLNDGVQGDDVAYFAQLLRVALRQPNLPYIENLDESLQQLAKLPVLCASLFLLFERQPQRCLRLVDELGKATRMGEAALAPLQPLQASPDAITQTERHVPEWAEVVLCARQLHKPALLYQFARRLCNERPAVPGSLRRNLGAGERMQRELAHLERLQEEHPERNDLTVRITNLRSRLQSTPNLQSPATDQACQRLLFTAAEATVSAGEYLLQQCYRRRFQQLVGALPKNLEWNNDLSNAVLMSFDIESNRRLLRRLLRYYLSGDRHWPRHHPVNQQFLIALGQRGVDVEVWTSRFPRRFTFVRVRGGFVRLYLEDDPLRILQMGNLFSTCLSRGGINSFSAVTNAVELNKRVIYALDASGHVVGRQLIGINQNGGLAGFHIYTNLSDEKSNKELHNVFRRYVKSFAACSHLTLENEGPIPTLFAREWYDDGIVDWDDDQEKSSFHYCSG